MRGEEQGAAQTDALPEISVEEVKAKRDRGEDFDILDVRNPEEWQICHIDGAKLIPLGELQNRLDELDLNRDIVVHCKGGGRSAKAVAQLQQAGFKNVRNVTGGITAWAKNVDTDMPMY